MRDPTKKPYEHRSDPNYYRVGYQLAAQLVNRRLAESSRPARPPTAEDDEALKIATEILESVDAMLAWYGDRERKANDGWRVWASGLEPHEKRLREFLECTVRPCMQLVRAAALFDSRPHAELDKEVAPILDAARKQDAISYRAQYAVACWFARRDPRDAQPALAHLLTALRSAPRDSGHELAEWSIIDPALEPVRAALGTDDFIAEVEPFRRPKRAARAGEGDLPDLIMRRLQGGATDEFEVLPAALDMEDDVARTVAAFMNTEGGTLLVGAVPRSDNGRWADDYLHGDVATVEGWALTGVDHEVVKGDWPAYEKRVRDLIGARITPDPRAAYTCARHEVGGRTLLVIQVRPAEKSTWIRTPDGHEEFWGRNGAANEEFTGSARDDFMERVRARRKAREPEPANAGPT